MERFAALGEAPYYAVIFTSKSTDDQEGYEDMAMAMVELAAQQKGYLGIESTTDKSGHEITVSYWADEDAVLNWKAVAKHKLAQKLAKERWYERYIVRVAKVERCYEGPSGRKI